MDIIDHAFSTEQISCEAQWAVTSGIDVGESSMASRNGFECRGQTFEESSVGSNKLAIPGITIGF